jgi:hypothetical protein
MFIFLNTEVFEIVYRYGRVRQATDGNVIRHIGFLCCVTDSIGQNKGYFPLTALYITKFTETCFKTKLYVNEVSSFNPTPFLNQDPITSCLP